MVHQFYQNDGDRRQQYLILLMDLLRFLCIVIPPNDIMDFEKKNENLEHLKVKQKGGQFFELPGRQKGPRLNSRIKESILHIGIIIQAVINYCSFMIKCGKQKINEVSNIFCVKKKKKKRIQ